MRPALATRAALTLFALAALGAVPCLVLRALPVAACDCGAWASAYDGTRRTPEFPLFLHARFQKL